MYQELNGEMKIEETLPDAEESKQFCSGICGEAQEHEQNAEWLKQPQGQKSEMVQESITITTEMVVAQVKKNPNWRVLGPDGIQGYWLNNLASLWR